mgnify:CR=1 FL=1
MNLKQPITVVLFYDTVHVNSESVVFFAEDIYDWLMVPLADAWVQHEKTLGPQPTMNFGSIVEPFWVDMSVALWAGIFAGPSLHSTARRLLHRVHHVEDRQVHGHDHAADHHAEEHDHERLEHAEQAAHGQRLVADLFGR